MLQTDTISRYNQSIKTHPWETRNAYPSRGRVFAHDYSRSCASCLRVDSASHICEKTWGAVGRLIFQCVSPFRRIDPKTENNVISRPWVHPRTAICVNTLSPWTVRKYRLRVSAVFYADRGAAGFLLKREETRERRKMQAACISPADRQSATDFTWPLTFVPADDVKRA